VGFSAYWARASCRRRWPALVGIALLLGLTGGLSMFAIAGARRTQSAYPRFLRSTNPSTMVVDVGGLDNGGDASLDAIADLPQVQQARAYAAFYVARWGRDGPDFTQDFEAIGSIDGRYFDQDRFTPIKGRMSDPRRPDEVVVNEEAARRYGYHVGQRIDFGAVSRTDVENPDPALLQDPKPRLLVHATIVGVGAFIEEVEQDDTDRSALVLFTPAFVREAKGLELYAWQGLVLRNGDADVAAVKRAAARTIGGPQIFRVTSTDTFHAVQATRPVSLALGVFGAIVGLAGLVLVSQALARHLRGRREDQETARALGADPNLIARASVIAPAIAILAGVLLAVFGALLASPAMPIGPVRRVEVASGFDADWTVLGVGALVATVVLLVTIGVLAWHETHRARAAAAVRADARRGLLPGPAALPPTTAVGLRFATASGHGATAAAVRSVMASAVVAVTALVAALTFGASMQHLVANPRLFGWNWNVALVDGAGYGNTKPAATEAAFSANPDIEAWGGAFYGGTNVNGSNIPVLGMDPSSAAVPPIIDGRMIERPGEIVLGTATIERLHLHIGDTVRTSAGRVRVVGTATFPTIGVVHGDHTSLGVGGIVVPAQVPGYDRNLASPDGVGPTPADEYGPNVLFVRFRDGVDERTALKRLHRDTEKLADYNGITVIPVQRSAEIVNADNVSNSSALLGGAVAIAALASLALALTSAVRGRRRQLALLKALGFTRRQVSATVAWQATTVLGVGLVVGVPLGIVLGRALWDQFARQLDVVAQPAVPAILIGIVVVAAVVATNALAALPARAARTVAPAAASAGRD
jgi:ABC-type lipoprotein release transport system permease subunit